MSSTMQHSSMRNVTGQERSLIQGKHRVRHSCSQTYLDRGFKSTENAEKVPSGNERKHKVRSRALDDNELVKHMSNLPGFLQQEEREKTVQGKALSFGVLDWKRLEKWKYTERMPGRHSKKDSCPNSRKQPSSRYPGLSNSGKQPAVNDSHSSLNPRSSREEIECLRSKGKETCNQKYHTAESIKIGRQTSKFSDQIHPEANAYKSKRNTQKEMVSEREASSSSSHYNQSKHKIVPLSTDKVSAQRKQSETRFDEEKITFKCSSSDVQKKSFSERSRIREPGAYLDAKLPGATRKKFSDFTSGEYSVDIPHSCPLQSSAVDPYNVASRATDADTSEETIRPSAVVEASDSKQTGAIKGRSSSPTRRFSFNLGRMTRSFSFKESSSVPQLSSTYTTAKSGPVGTEVAPRMDSFERDQANTSSRSRSSPLRRLLDPLFKHKTSSDTSRPLNGSLRSTTASSIGTKGLPEDKKLDPSTVQALLQLTFKNGLPFFRLVVENNKDMLAAAVKRLPTSEKIDPSMVYSFYSVQEIKQKSMNWISYGSKSKTCSLGYSIIGQMKISNFYHPDECDARECILYGVDPGQIDKQMLAFVPNREIAAIVVKTPRMDTKQIPFGRKFPRLKLERQAKENSKSTVVILPGAVHGIPIKGAPTSLISRWRSGGSCDCGGWDVGCRLQILADCSRGSASSSTDQLNLFIEGAETKNGPVFSMKPLSDEFYSIELDASISLLEAFATSVAFLTARKIPEIIEAKGQSQAECVSGANAGFDTRKTPSFQEHIPARYITCPPMSPVGRI